MGVAIKITGFQISPYLGQVTTNDEGGKDIPLVSLSISGSNTIPVNTSSVQLSIVYIPSNTTQKGVDWVSSNPSVASVNSTGLVTVVNRPSTDTTVIITATSSQNKSIKATYSVVVSQQSTYAYITDGLVQYYDAIDNQGRDVERVSGTVATGSKWVDVIANNSLSILPNFERANFGEFDAKSYNLLAFKNANNTGFVSVSGWPFPYVDAGDFTIECVMTMPSTLIDANTGFACGYNANESGRYRFQVGISPSGSIKLSYRTASGSWQEQFFTTESVIKASTFYNIAIVRKNGIMTAYLNGNSIGTINFDKRIFSSMLNSVWNIADNGQPAAYHAYRFYNRALTQDELTQNVNYDISRYK